MEKAIDIKRRAQRCVQNGDLDGALREYEKLVGTPESDPYNFVLLADLLYKKGDQGRAAERYLSGVTAYEKAGLYKNAIAVCKKMMRLALSQAKVLRHLAELHALDGLTSEASVYFAQYSDHMVRGNNPQEAASALRRAFDNGQENVKLLEQLCEVLLLEGENSKAAAALREAAGHWRTRGQVADVRRCLERANQLDPANSTPPTDPGHDAAEGMPITTLPVASTPAKPATASTLTPRPAGLELDRPTPLPTPAALEHAHDLSIELPARSVAPAEPPAIEPGLVQSSSTSVPQAIVSEAIEQTPRFVPPSGPTSASIAPGSALEQGLIDTPMQDEERAQEAGVYEIAPDEVTNYESAVSEAENALPMPAASVTPPSATALPVDRSVHDVPSPSTLALRPEGLLEGVALVEQQLQRAQEEFRAGDREKASQALVEAALTYESLGRLDSAATIFRSLGRGSTSPVEVMKLWLANCEKRNDRAEGSQVACELGDRALNEGQLTQARTWFEHATAIDPTNDAVQRRLQRLNGAGPGSVPPVQARAATPPLPEGGRVEVAFGRGHAVTSDLSGLLKEFQRGVESQLDGDAQGHYDLGMAYHEMGLQDQAIEAFRIAARDPRLAGRSHEMLGRCHADQGTHDEAVSEFGDALRRTSLDAAGEAELRFQLALSLAALGDLAGAVAEMEIADMRQPGRDDVASRLDDWRRGFGKAA